MLMTRRSKRLTGNLIRISISEFRITNFLFFRKRALVHHPDRHAGASEEEKKEHERKFKEVGEAYGVLSDAKKRSRYDNGHDLEDLDGHGHGFGGDIDPNQVFQAFFGGAGGGGHGGMHGASFSFGGGPGGGTFFQFG